MLLKSPLPLRRPLGSLVRPARHRGGKLVTWILPFTVAAYNVVRLHRLLLATA